MAPRTLVFAFDGTSQDPEKAKQAVQPDGSKVDQNISNVLKFHLLAGGVLSKQGAGWTDDQLCFYYKGVGTYGKSMVSRLINTAFAPASKDVKDIVRAAMKDFTKTARPGDRVVACGFSRGAALARRFSAEVSLVIGALNSRYGGIALYETVFDTVADINGTNFNNDNRPKDSAVYERKRVPRQVQKALHMVSLDDKRTAFQPTLFNVEDKVTEVWFSGAHSDVGGGYYRDELANITLVFLLDWVRKELDLDIRSPETVLDGSRSVPLLPVNADYSIELDDLQYSTNTEENCLGPDHIQDEWWRFIAGFTFDKRLCCVIEDDKPVQNDTASKNKPIVHFSVLLRAASVGSYCPESLKGRYYRVWDEASLATGETYEPHKWCEARGLNMDSIADILPPV